MDFKRAILIMFMLTFCFVSIASLFSLSAEYLGETGKASSDFIANALSESESYIDSVLSKVNDEGYSVYLDGVSININNVYISDYTIRVDDEEKKVFLTKKTRSNTRYIPMPYYSWFLY